MNDQIEWKVSAPLTRSQRTMLETMARSGDAARREMMVQAGSFRGAPTPASIQLYEDYKRLRRMGLVMQRKDGGVPLRWILTDIGRQIASAMFHFEPVKVD